MSFLHALEHDLVVVGKDLLAAAPVIGTVIGFVNPPLGAAIVGTSGRITALVIQAEQAFPDAKQGALKSQQVQAGFENIMGAVQEITGKQWTWDKSALQSAIDAEVTALNAKGAFKQTVKQQ